MEFEKININEFLEQQKAIRLYAHKNKEWGFEDDLETFIKKMRVLPSGNYGTRIQNRVIQKLNFKKIRASQNKGDCLDNFGDHYEIKTSIIDGVNVDLNVVNVRKWQEVHYYIIAFDCRSETPFKCYFFRLSKNEMLLELERLNTSNAAGTIESNENNDCVEKRFSIKIDSPNWLRWCDKYLSKAGELI